MTERPKWMDTNQAAKATPKPPTARPQTQSYIKSQLPPHSAKMEAMHLKLPNVVTAGIGIIATLMMFLFFFWITILVFGWINPPDGGEFGLVFASDYLSTSRVVLATVISGLATAFTWSISDSFID